jgi:hypothetical protein
VCGSSGGRAAQYNYIFVQLSIINEQNLDFHQRYGLKVLVGAVLKVLLLETVGTCGLQTFIRYELHGVAGLDYGI